MKVCIIGGGPSGMMAALAARRKGHNVTIIEHNARLGKKILSTGAGRCNLSNEDQNYNHYHGGDYNVIQSVLSNFSLNDTLSFLSEYGLYTCNKNGYIYPYNEQAAAVVDIFEQAIKLENINVLTNTNVNKIEILKDNKSRFKLFLNKAAQDLLLYCDDLIIAAGSKAAPKLGSDGSGYYLAKCLGHSIVEPLPALCGLKSSEKFFKTLKGIRCKANADLYIDNKLINSEAGEVQFNDYGLSGICIMQHSYLASKALRNNKKVTIKLSFLPKLTVNEITKLLDNKKDNCPNLCASELLTSIVHKNLASIILKLLGVANDLQIGSLLKSDIENIAKLLNSFEVNIIDTNSYEDSQVCSGGVSLKEINTDLSSMLVKGLYFAGEILDVNGDCGGYNLQWALSSGFIAGNSIND